MSGHATIGTEVLSRAESIALSDCEERIERGMKTYIEVGMALGAIRENRLYRIQHDTFEEYCAARWNFTGRRGRQLIEAAEIGNMFPVENSRQAAELAKVPEPDRADVLAEATERTDGKPTAAAIREVHEERTRPTPSPGTPDAALSPSDVPGATPAPAGHRSDDAPSPREPAPTPEPAAAPSTAPADSGPGGEVAPAREGADAASPPPGSPATWTDEQHEANRLEVERKAAIAACERTAESLVLEISGMVTTIIDGLDCGAPGIPVSLADIDACREALDRLEARVINL